ncbi:MCE family protein [Microvirga sp. KLBC 81]|uniref:MlaD family protein n=1 Tax=Microvirga sp. KLBC 81 TaxID=1862707 RepID=UPI000D51DA6C|nr:MlaD family protein [Microvirga sp. KLBC 81]PVE23684.1 MCE family protein [Microvirga sp. KLBC 81]
METRANYALIGIFTLAVIAAAFGFVYWFSGGDRGQARQSVRIVFSGSVSGLSQGSTVSFNGLRVGEVTEISLLPEDPRRVVAIVQVGRDIPIRADTRARLEYQGLTGVANIGLSGGEPGAPPLVAGPGQPMPTIFADRSDFQDLIETARNIARRADDVLERVGRVVADNEGSINRTVQNVERFSQALGENAEGIDRFLAQVGQAAEKIGPLAEKLDTLATNVDQVVRAVEPQRVTRIVENVDNFTQALGENRQVVSEALRDAASLIDRLNETAPKLDSAITEISTLTKAVDPNKVRSTVDNVQAFMDTMNSRRPDIDKAIQEARSITEKLNKSADRIDGVLAGAEKFLGSASGEAGKGAFDEIRAAAVSVRDLANDLNERTRGIEGVVSGVGRFTDSGLREYEALAAEGRKTLGDISRAVRSIERNPQQFLFGSRPNLPEYNGRR